MTEAISNRLKKVLNKTGFLSGLSDSQTRDLLQQMKRVPIEANTEIIREGDRGDHFYLIESGIYEAWKKKRNIDGFTRKYHAMSNHVNNNFVQSMPRASRLSVRKNSHHGENDDDDEEEEEEEELLAVYANQGAFGELTLMYNSARAASIRSRTKGALWCIDRNTFKKVIVLSHIQQIQKFKHLIASTRLLQQFNLNDTQQENMAECMKLFTFYKDEQIVSNANDGNVGDDEEEHKVYFVVNGTVDIINEETKEVIASKQENAYFGGNVFAQCASEMAEIGILCPHDCARLIDETALQTLQRQLASE